MLHSEPKSYIIQKQKDGKSKRKRSKTRNYLNIFASAKKKKLPKKLMHTQNHKMFQIHFVRNRKFQRDAFWVSVRLCTVCVCVLFNVSQAFSRFSK